MSYLLLHGLYAQKGHFLPKKELALKALNLEQNILKEPVGSQDQVAAAFGGFNKIDFGSNGEEFICNPLKLSSRRREELNEWDNSKAKKRQLLDDIDNEEVYDELLTEFPVLSKLIH